MNDEEEDFFDGDLGDFETDDNIGRVGPNVGANEVAVPRNGGSDGNGDEEEQFVGVEARPEGKVEEGEEGGGWKRVLEMTEKFVSVSFNESQLVPKVRVRV